MSSFDTLYQFWIHTRLIGKLGPVEWVFNTPSHHRVHHARNPKYLDKNYAGSLIIWDRMFGTFQAEEEEPVYGLVKPLNSWNPLWANLHVWNELFRDAWLAPRWSDKLRIWFMPPGWRPEGLPSNPPPPEVSRETVVPYDTKIPLGLNAYALRNSWRLCSWRSLCSWVRHRCRAARWSSASGSCCGLCSIWVESLNSDPGHLPRNSRGCR